MAPRLFFLLAMLVNPIVLLAQQLADEPPILAFDAPFPDLPNVKAELPLVTPPPPSLQPMFGVRILPPKKAKDVGWDDAQRSIADAIYNSSIEVFVRETGLKHRPQPIFTLVLGSDENAVVTTESEISHQPLHTEIHMQVWNPRVFARGCLRVIGQQVLTNYDVTGMADLAYSWGTASVNVNDLRKRK